MLKSKCKKIFTILRGSFFVDLNLIFSLFFRGNYAGGFFLPVFSRAALCISLDSDSCLSLCGLALLGLFQNTEKGIVGGLY